MIVGMILRLPANVVASPNSGRVGAEVRQRKPPEQWRIRVRRNRPRSPAFRWCCGSRQLQHNSGVIARRLADPRASKKVARDVRRRSEARRTPPSFSSMAPGPTVCWAHVIERCCSPRDWTMARRSRLASLSDDVAALERRWSGPTGRLSFSYMPCRRRGIVRSRRRVQVAGLHFGSLSRRRRNSRGNISIATSRRRRRRNHPDSHGFLWMPNTGLARPGATPIRQAALLAAIQRPIAVAAIQEKA